MTAACSRWSARGSTPDDMMDLEYDDSNLRHLFAAMDPRQRLKTMKKAFRREAARVRKVAVKNLRESIRTDRTMEKGVRSVVLRKHAGFRVTVGTKKTRKGKSFGYHRNRRGEERPILLWAEDGTKSRYTRSFSKTYVRSRKGHYTGRMKRYAFMERTRNEVISSVTDNLHNELRRTILEDAKKYGCK